MKLTKTSLKKAYNKMSKTTKIKSTIVLNDEKILIKTTQKVSESYHIFSLHKFFILNVFYDEKKGTLESTQWSIYPNAVKNYVNYFNESKK